MQKVVGSSPISRLREARFLLSRFRFLGVLPQDVPNTTDGRTVPDPWLEAIRDTGERLKVEIAWQNGDVLMLDNTRFMHGRTAIENPGERLIATYFGYLNFAIPDPEEPANAIWRRGVLV